MARKILKVTNIDDARQRMKAMQPSCDGSAFSCMALVSLLHADIESVMKKGCTVEDVTVMLSEIAGSELKVITVRSCISKVRARKADKTATARKPPAAAQPVPPAPVKAAKPLPAASAPPRPPIIPAPRPTPPAAEKPNRPFDRLDPADAFCDSIPPDDDY